MPTIVHINDKLSLSGGVEIYISQVDALLQQYGWTSYWVALAWFGSHVEIKSTEKKLCWQGTLSKLKYSPMAELIKKSRGLFHVHSLSSPSLMNALFALAPVVRTMHEPRIFCPGQGKFWRTDEVPCTVPAGFHCIYHTYQKQCCNRHPVRLLKALQNTRYELAIAGRRYSSVIANSRWIANQAKVAGLPSEEIHVIPYFTKQVEYTSIPKHKLPRILFVGRLTKEKGLHYLLHALRVMHDFGASAHLDIVGDGHERTFFESEVRKLELHNTCTFHGWLGRKKIQAKLQACNVVAFPSIYPEAFGIVGIEAMMHGRPVVAFDVGGVQEWLHDKVNGHLIPPKQVELFAKSLVQLCLDYEYASQLGDSGRAIAEEKFIPETHMALLTALYRKILV